MKTLFPTKIRRTGYLLFSVLPGGQHLRSLNTALVQLVGGIQDVISSSLDKTQGAFHLVKISGISGSAVNRTRFVGLSHWKIPRKSGKSKKVVPFSRMECRVPFTFLVVCTSSRSTVGHRHVPGFTTKWNNFLPIGNSTFATTEISGFFS